MKKLKVLVCDDSKLVRLKLTNALNDLELEDYEVEVFGAEDGKKGVEMYKELKPDIMFVDIVMPVKSGVEAVAEIMEFDPNAKLIMATSVGTKENLEQALKDGASDFIQKPLNNMKVERMIRKIINE